MANIMRFDPFTELLALQKQLFNDSWLTLPTSRMMPTTDVYTKENKLVVEAHVPDFDEKDISIDIDNGLLEIQGQKDQTEDSKGRKYVVRETSSMFYRSIRLPDEADISHVEAGFDKGVLTVSVPFKKLPDAKKIAIKHSKDTKKLNK